VTVTHPCCPPLAVCSTQDIEWEDESDIEDFEAPEFAGDGRGYAFGEESDEEGDESNGEAASGVGRSGLRAGSSAAAASSSSAASSASAGGKRRFLGVGGAEGNTGKRGGVQKGGKKARLARRGKPRVEVEYEEEQEVAGGIPEW
jgi:hypothetical protein